MPATTAASGRTAQEQLVGVTHPVGATVWLCFFCAGKCSFPKAWIDYQACASYDLENWFRCVWRDSVQACPTPW